MLGITSKLNQLKGLDILGYTFTDDECHIAFDEIILSFVHATTAEGIRVGVPYEALKVASPKEFYSLIKQALQEGLDCRATRKKAEAAFRQELIQLINKEHHHD